MKYQFPYTSLLKHRRYRRDLCRLLLAGILREQGKIQRQQELVRQRQQSQLSELKAMAEEGEVDIDGASARRFYLGQLRYEQAILQRNLELINGQIQMARDTLVKADQEVKVLEKLDEKRKTEFLYQQERRTAIELEETWAASRSQRGWS